MTCTHIMVDTETLGLKAGSVILSIGAVAFDPMSNNAFSDEFYCAIDLKDAQNCGLTIEAGTVAWWMQQNDEARKAAFSGGYSLRQALCDFRALLQRARNLSPERQLRVWSHGISADIIWLEAAYQAVNFDLPWAYREPRDTRTIYDLAEIDLKDFAAGGVEHNALDDARAQANAVIAAYRKLGLARNAADGAEK